VLDGLLWPGDIVTSTSIGDGVLHVDQSNVSSALKRNSGRSILHDFGVRSAYDQQQCLQHDQHVVARLI